MTAFRAGKGFGGTLAALLAALLSLALIGGLSAPALAEEAPIELFFEGKVETFSSEEDGTDGEELLDAYVQRMIDNSLNKPLLRRRFTVGGSLTGMDRTVYNILKERIGEIAAGTRTSTVMEIGVEEMAANDSSLYFGPWSADDLGVSAIVSNGAINEDALIAAKAKLDAMTSINFGAIIDALLSDCPSEMYWYDKTTGSTNVFSCGWIASYNPSIREYVLSVGGSHTFSGYMFAMCVSQDYFDGVNYYYPDDDDPTLCYRAGLNPDRVLAAKRAIENARSIVTASAGGDVIDRLRTYKDEICRLVSYNSVAANDSTAPPYGDPWQLIYVFDGNSSTNVVCEGYSKAFKYLFDLSEFGDDYACLLPTGRMIGGTGAGRHMWNIVRLSDGNNYLVDVTNCDQGSSGWPDKLFLVNNPDGEWNDYTFNIGSSRLRYIYDGDTMSTYPQSMLDLSVKIVPYGISVAPDIDGGSAAADRDEAAPGVTVTVTLTPEEGFTAVGAWYDDSEGVRHALTPDAAGAYSFPMPASNVTVGAAFKPLFGTAGFTLPRDVKTVEDSAFEGAALTAAEIPGGCESIGAYAFKNTGLTKIRIPASVTFIDGTAFDGCGRVYIFGAPGSWAAAFCEDHDNCVFVAE